MEVKKIANQQFFSVKQNTTESLCSRYFDRNLSSRGSRGEQCAVLFITVYHCSIRSGPFAGKMDGSDHVQSLQSLKICVEQNNATMFPQWRERD